VGSEYNNFSEAETKTLDIAFDYNRTVEDAFSMLKNLNALLWNPCFESRVQIDRLADAYMSSARYFRSKSLNLYPAPMLTRKDSKLSM
jgi:hypothetical protein